MKILILNVCESILRPLASILLRCGMTWREFAELSKVTFVNVATNEFGKRGRPTSISRVCILTGIHRKEVKRLRDQIEDQEIVLTKKSSDATRMLNGWHRDEFFLDDRGKPRILSLDGPSPSFAELFARYGGDTPQQTMLRELKDSEAIKVSADGEVEVRSRYFMPQALSQRNIEIFGNHLSQHAETLRHNTIQPHEKNPPRFERAAMEFSVDPKYAGAFHEFIESRSQQLLEDVDDWLLQHQLDQQNAKEVDPITLGLGIYAIGPQKSPR